MMFRAERFGRRGGASGGVSFSSPVASRAGLTWTSTSRASQMASRVSILGLDPRRILRMVSVLPVARMESRRSEIPLASIRRRSCSRTFMR